MIYSPTVEAKYTMENFLSFIKYGSITYPSIRKEVGPGLCLYSDFSSGNTTKLTSDGNLEILEPDGVKRVYEWDPVTKEFDGWWLRGPYADQRSCWKDVGNENPVKYKSLQDVYNNNPESFTGPDILKLSPELRDNEVLFKELVEMSNSGHFVCLMSERIQLDPEIAKFILRNNPTNIGYLRPIHLLNKYVMMVLAETGSNMIREAPDFILQDRDIMETFWKNRN